MGITDVAASLLKKEKLIEGRRPNYYVAASIAAATNQKASYILNKAFEDDHYRNLILSYLTKFKQGERSEFEKLIFPKLSDALNEKQKKDKVKNLLQAMKRDRLIRLNGHKWLLV